MHSLPRIARLLSFNAILTAIAGCASLPTIVPDMARQKAGVVQIDGALGPLPPARSRAVLEELKNKRRDSNIFERHLAIEGAIVGSPLVAGNKVVLLQDGPATYQAMFAAIAAAKDHIHLETYIFEDDEAGQRFADALLARQAAGVQVNLIYDSVGALGTKREFFERLASAGMQVLEYNPVNPLKAKAGWDVNERDHRKLLVVDGRVAFLGGINISSVYSGSSSPGPRVARSSKDLPWRDTHLRIEGPVVAEFQRLFIETWRKQRAAPLAEKKWFPALARRGDEVMRAIGSSPDEPYSQIYATLLSAITSAESSIALTFAYFVPDPQLLEALKAAAARGVDVQLLLPSESDSALVFHAGRSYYDELLQGGIRIYERQDALLHAKTAVIDGVWSTVGSTNLDWRSFLHNQELNAVILGAEFGAQMRAAFERDLAASLPITLEQWQRRTIGLRLKEAFARMWGYWL